MTINEEIPQTQPSDEDADYPTGMLASPSRTQI